VLCPIKRNAAKKKKNANKTEALYLRINLFNSPNPKAIDMALKGEINNGTLYPRKPLRRPDMIGLMKGSVTKDVIDIRNIKTLPFL
jgi:hypothetical protein